MAEALEARLARAPHRHDRVRVIGRRQAHLGADHDLLPRVERVERTAEVLLRASAAIAGCRVEVRDARLDRPLDAAHPVIVVGTDHQPASGTRTEPQDGNAAPCPAELSLLDAASHNAAALTVVSIASPSSADNLPHDPR